MRSQTSPAGVDEEARRKFEAAWQSHVRPELSEFLPSETDANYLPTLEELIAIDMELAWKRHGSAATAISGDGAQPPPLLEHYLASHPMLMRHPEAMVRLAAEEYRSRLACGDRPCLDEYQRRHPQLASMLPSAFASIEATTRPQVALASSDQLGRFRLTVEQGRGGFGVVWRANDTTLGRQIAVKELLHGASVDPETRRRFLAEARIAAQLQHPGVVPIYDVGTEGERPYYAMKLVSGRTLADAIAQHHESKASASEHALQEARLLTAFRSVVQTMAFAHSRRVIHRDLKPQNIVLGDYGETIILDWGLAKDLAANASADAAETGHEGAQPSPEATAAGAIMGTPAYMSPEQAQGSTAAIDARSDVFALGAILYHLLAGQRPFAGDSSAEVLRKVAEADPPALRNLRRSVPRPLEAICRKAMAKHPSDRYPDAAAMASDLDRHFADEPISAQAESTITRVRRWTRHHRQLATVSASAFILVVGLLVAGWLLHSAQSQRDNEAAARLRETHEGALHSEKLALARIRAGDFFAAAETLADAAQSLEPWPSLAEDRGRLREKQDRAHRVADFYRLHERIWHDNYHEFDDQVQESIPIALELIGLAEIGGSWDHLPDADLDDEQRTQLREDAHGLMLIQSITLAKAVLSDFRKTAKTKEAKDALAWCQRTQKRQPTQTIELLEIVLKYSTGEIHPLLVPFAMKFVAVRSPQTSTDFHCMGVLHGMLGQVRQLKDQPKTKEGIGTDLWTFLEFVEQMTGSGLDLADPHLASQRHFREVVRREPRRYWAYVFLGAGLLQQGDFMGAELAFNTCATIRPEAPEGYFARATSLYRQSEKAKDDAVRKELQSRCHADLDTALRLGRHSGEIHFARADLLLRLPHRLEEGIESLCAYVESERPLRTLKGHWNYPYYRRKVEIVADAANRLRPKSPAAVVPEILARHALNQTKEAIRLASEYRGQGVDLARVQGVLGEIAFAAALEAKDGEANQAFETATRHFQESLKHNSRAFAANMGIARIAAIRESKRVGLAQLDTLVAPNRAWTPWQETEMLLLRAEWAADLGETAKANESIRRAARIDLAASRKAAAKLGLDKP